MVKENLKEVEEKITAACERAGRDRNEVTLIAVSKTKPMEMIEEAYSAGKRDFGENKAQEMKETHDALPDDIKWHFIGHLQTNKVKYVVGRATLIHSVDSLHLAEAIEKESEKKNLISDILIEVNVADIKESTLYPILKKLEKNGFMTTYTKEYQGRKRKYYSLTDAGVEELKFLNSEWISYRDTIDGIVEGRIKNDER